MSLPGFDGASVSSLKFSESRKQVGLFLGVERSPEGRATVQSRAFSVAAVKTFEKDGHVSQDLVRALLRKQWASPVFYKTCGKAHVAGVQLPIYLLGLILRCITHLSTIKSRQWIRQSLSARLRLEMNKLKRLECMSRQISSMCEWLTTLRVYCL